MALNAPRAWLICYDIANPRRLVRLHRFLKGVAQPVQYSVFHYEGSPARLGRLMQDIEQRIDTKEDDVRAYPVPNPVTLFTLGRGAMPSGVLLESGRSPVLAKLLRGTRNRGRIGASRHSGRPGRTISP